jgi:hypothetical protein
MRNIKSAPKDRDILLFYPMHGWSVGCWCQPGNGWWCEAESLPNCSGTEVMPGVFEEPIGWEELPRGVKSSQFFFS